VEKIHIVIAIFWGVVGFFSPEQGKYEIYAKNIMKSDWNNRNDTLLGIDRNKNGVRDEIDHWIEFKWKTKVMRDLMTAYARKYQETLEIEATPNNAQRWWEELELLEQCQFYITQSDLYYVKVFDFGRLQEQLRRKTANSYSRIKDHNIFTNNIIAALDTDNIHDFVVRNILLPTICPFKFDSNDEKNLEKDIIKKFHYQFKRSAVTWKKAGKYKIKHRERYENLEKIIVD
jgi:hypothetical protein